MARELVQTRADADTVEALEEFAEEKEITRSEAIRRLLRSGLEAQDEPDDETDGPDDHRTNPTRHTTNRTSMRAAE